MAQRKVRAKDLRKQRWAGIVAAVLAFVLIISLVSAYISQAVRNSETAVPEQQTELQPEDYLTIYQGEVDRLEEYLQDHEAGAAVLLELVENYRYLSFFQQTYFNNQEALEGYQVRLVSLYDSLVKLEPSNLQHRLELVSLYIEQKVDQQLIDEEIAVLQEQLRETPDPLVHLLLVELLSSTGETERLQEEEMWLSAYLEERLSADLAGNEERFYYAVLLGEYLDDPDTAEEILVDILEQEDEESKIYQESLNYLNYLRPENDNEELAP